MKILSTFFLAVFISFHLSSQAPSFQVWDYRFGGNNFDFPCKLLKTPDHGFLVCGNSLSQVGYDKTDSCRGGLDYWIVKTDSAGNKLWDKTFGGSETDNMTSAIVLPDSGYLLGGYSASGISGDRTQPNQNSSIPSYDYWIIRIDKNGNKIWDKSFGGDKKDELNSLLLLPDGSYLLGGYTYSDYTGDMSHHSFGDIDYWVIKVDSNGNKLWDINYGGAYSDRLMSLALTSDAGIILGGYSNSTAGFSKSQSSCSNSLDYWIVKINLNGTILWDKTFGGTSEDDLEYVVVLPDNKLVLSGSSAPGQGCDKSNANWGTLGYYDFWVVCTDSSGNKLWDKVYGGDRNEDDQTSMSVINGGLLICGTSYSGISGDKSEPNILNSEQPWAIAIDTLGNKLWDKTLHDPSNIEFCYGIQDDDGCFVFLSHTNTNGGYVSQARATGEDYWITKFCASAPSPVADYSSSSGSLCSNSCIDFTNHSLNATSYQWFFPGGTPANDTSENPHGICYFNSGTYDVTLVAGNSVGYDTLTLPGFVTVYPPLQFAPIRQSGDTLFSAPGFMGYQWYLNSSSIPGANNEFYVATQNGDYEVVVTDSNGCQAEATFLHLSTSIHELSGLNNYYSIRYVPGSLLLFINSSSVTTSEIKAADTLGQIIFSKKIVIKNGINRFEFPVTINSPGIYYIEVADKNQSITKKIFIR